MKQKQDQSLKIISLLFSILTILFLIFTFLFIGLKGVRVFLPSYPKRISLVQFLTGLTWRPDKGEYGALFLLINTVFTGVVSAAIAYPIAVLTALYIVKVASKKKARLMQSVIEVLAAVPSVVYGVFASGVIVSFVQKLANIFAYPSYGGRSVLSVILLLVMMILPSMISLSIIAFTGLDEDVEMGSYALGASKMETYFHVLIPAARPSLMTGLALALSRAFGEATAVSMVAGNRMHGPSFHPFQITRTITSTMLAGLSETQGLNYDVRYSLGIVLLLTIVLSNWGLKKLVKKMAGGRSE